MSDAMGDLIAAVEAGKRPWREWGETDFPHAEPILAAFDGSLDAAIALHEALLPGWRWNLWAIGGATVWSDVANVYAYDGPDVTPARALLLATLKAYRATLTPSTPHKSE